MNINYDRAPLNWLIGIIPCGVTERENSQEEMEPAGASLFTLLLAEQRYLPALVSCTSHRTMVDVTNLPMEMFSAGVMLVVIRKPSYLPATSSAAGRRVHVTFGSGTPYAVQVNRTDCMHIYICYNLYDNYGLKIIIIILVMIAIELRSKTKQWNICMHIPYLFSWLLLQQWSGRTRQPQACSQDAFRYHWTTAVVFFFQQDGSHL